VNKPKLTKWTPTTDLMMLRRMGKLIEELGELSNVAARCIIQGIDEVDPGTGKVNRQRLHDELADVLAQVHCTIETLGLSSTGIAERRNDKIAQMAEWEAMFASPQNLNASWEPVEGELVRYDHGETALALHGKPHAGGWHGKQCMGGSTFYSKVYRPSEGDRQTWVECAVRWRRVSREQALREAGLSNKLPARTRCLVRGHLMADRRGMGMCAHASTGGEFCGFTGICINKVEES